MKDLKLGIIGLSKGNGHPYSWSAIFNGYNNKFMKDCPFPVIPEYLSKQQFPRDTIKKAKVTHIWTQDKSLSKHVAKASNIENVVDNYKDLIGKVDAILLARDDYQNHYKISKTFIQEKLPIYIDKPLAINLKTANKILNLEKFENQIFTCSAIGYAKEFNLSKKILDPIGKIKHIDAYIMKDWDKYGIHIIEPVLKIISTQYDLENLEIKTIKITKSNDIKVVTINWSNNLITNFSTLGNLKTPIKITIYGEKNSKELIFKDSFFAFKKALQKFIDILLKKEDAPSKKFILKIIEIIERGNKYD